MAMDVLGDTPLTRFLATQTLTQLKALRSEYRAELDELRTRMAGLENELPLVEQAIVEKMGTRKRSTPQEARSGGNGIGPGPRGPSLREAILAVMHTRPAASWSRQELYDELRRLRQAPGGKHPKNTLGSRLMEMAQRGEVVPSDHRGSYRLGPRASAFKPQPLTLETG